MAKYLTASKLKGAIQALGNTRAKSALLDFLIVKRSMVLKANATPLGQPAPTSVAIGMKEPAFIQAARELASVHDIPRPVFSDEKAYFEPFSTAGDKGGFKKGKWLSNGTNTTIRGVNWANVINLTNDDPKQASLAPNYEQALEVVLLKEGHGKIPKPEIGDLALWMNRRTDLDPVLGAETNPVRRGKLLIEKMISELQLTKKEIAHIFTVSDLALEDADIDTNVAAPSSYIPDLTLSSATTAVVGTSSITSCALDLVVALAAKPFVILSGTSGTGKSRSALRLGEALQALYAGTFEGQLFQLVAVGPDWTTPKKLVGFRTPFGRSRKRADGSETNESYEITDTLRIILRASHKDAVKVPHIVIFDEMNLSHVERYFAPFLSLMEASNILEDGENAPLVDLQSLVVISEILDLENMLSPEAEAARLLVEREQPLTLPLNVFFAGTMNVDETTYMFSPKVLDRAHVLEIRALTPSQYILGTETEPSIALEMANELLRDAIDDREARTASSADPSAIVDLLLVKHGVDAKALQDAKARTLKVLDGAFVLLAPVGFEFGFRVLKEIYGYLYVWTRARILMGESATDAMAKWNEGLDRALFQKLLPKLHGNRTTLSDSLIAMAAFLDGQGASGVPAAKYTLGSDTVVKIESSQVLAVPTNTFSRSTAKLRAMHSRLLTRNYTSFVR